MEGPYDRRLGWSEGPATASKKADAGASAFLEAVPHVPGMSTASAPGAPPAG